MPAPEICPNCGAEVSPNAKACPECGADHETGWSESAAASGLDLPDDEFDYDDFVAREFGEAKPKHAIPWFWCAVALLLVALFLITMFWHK